MSPGLQFEKVVAVVNTSSGGVAANAEARLRSIVARYDLEVEVISATRADVTTAVRKAVEAAPDLLILVAGDGTAGLAAELCGMEGPLLAPLAGGTMNMLPHALYGPRPWPEALEAVLSRGVARTVSSGEVSGRPFYVAAIIGSPALLADAREAMRSRRFRLAFLRFRRAWARAFSGRLRFSLAGEPRRKAAALSVLCPLVSRAMADDVALEVAVMDPRGAADVFRIGLSALFGRWRSDPSICMESCVHGQAWGRARIPVLLDGESHRMDSPLDIRFNAQGFRAAVPGDAAAGTPQTPSRP